MIKEFAVTASQNRNRFTLSINQHPEIQGARLKKKKSMFRRDLNLNLQSLSVHNTQSAINNYANKQKM